MKKTILSIALFLFASVFVNAQDKSIAPAPAAVAAPAVDMKNAPEFKFEIEEYNYGTIKQGDKVTYDFNFVNTGKEPLIISEAHGSCGCTVPSWPKEPIAKGGKGSIHVEFNSTGKMGMQDKTVTITSNAKSGQKVLHLKGNVEAPPVTPATDKPAEH
jgi:hypothetical protein